MLRTIKNALKLLFGIYKKCDCCSGATYASNCCGMPTKKYWRRYENNGRYHWVAHYQCTSCGQYCREIPCGCCDGVGIIEN